MRRAVQPLDAEGIWTSDRVVPADELHTAALKEATRLAGLDPRAYGRTKTNLRGAVADRGAYVPSRDRMLFVCPPLCLKAEEVDAIADLLDAALAAVA